MKMIVNFVVGFVLFVVCISTSRATGINGKIISDRISRVLRDAPECDQADMGDDGLCFTVSSVVERQIVVVNISSEMAIIVDPNTDQYYFVQNNGPGIVIDQGLNLGFETQSSNTSLSVGFLSQLQNCNITSLIEDLNPVDVSNLPHNSSFFSTILNILSHFGEDIRELVTDAGKLLMRSVRKVFAFIIHPLKTVLQPILDFAIDGWEIIRGGLLSFLKVFKWMGQFVSKITGGIGTLIGKAIRFPLKLIIKAINGVKALFYLLKSVVEHFDISKLLRSIVKAPIQIAKYIFGLGGEMVKNGVTFLYNVVSNILEFVGLIKKDPAMAIGYVVTTGFQYVVDSIVQFYPCRPKERSELNTYADDMQQLVEKQSNLFNNTEELKNFNDFWTATKGEGKFDVNGVDLTQVFNELLGTTWTSGISMVSGILNVLQPVLPYNFTVPTLLTNFLQRADTPTGIEQLRMALPDIERISPPVGQLRSHPPEEHQSLTTHELVEKSPIAHQIYCKIVEVVEKDGKVSVKDILNSDSPEVHTLRSQLLYFSDA